MNLEEMIIWLGLIFLADILAMVLDRYIQGCRNKARESVLCEICHKPRKLKETWDKQLWVCRGCNKLYIVEHKPEIKENSDI